MKTYEIRFHDGSATSVEAESCHLMFLENEYQFFDAESSICARAPRDGVQVILIVNNAS